MKVSKSQQLYHEGWEALKFRDYELASKKLNELVDFDPSHQDGLLKLAGLEYRKTDYHKALEYVNRVLKLDTYNTEANYLAGIIYRALNDSINALESFGWAARSMKYRSVSYAQMAEIYFSLQNLERANLNANKALDYNTYNLNARKIKLLLQRKNNSSNAFNEEYNALIKIDPLNHFALIESQLLSGDAPLIMPKEINNEFPDESILELAIYYKDIGLVSEAMEILKLSKTSNAKIHLWAAYLTQDMAAGPSNEYLGMAIADPVDFVFPYRQETIDVLQWAISQNANWKFKYYLAQNYIAVGQKTLGLQLLKECGNEPDSDIFYRFRAKMFKNEDYSANEKDYLKALQLNNTDWKLREEVIQFI